MIKINKDTIIKNPDAGRSGIVVQGHGELRIQFIVTDAIKPNHTFGLRNLFIETLQVRDNFSKGIAVTSDYDNLERLGEVEGVKILQGDYEIPTQMISSMGSEPEFLFEYEDIDVECQYCGGRFSWKDLDADSFGHGAWSNTICPECGSWDCCELEFEKV